MKEEEQGGTTAGRRMDAEREVNRAGLATVRSASRAGAEAEASPPCGLAERAPPGSRSTAHRAATAACVRRRVVPRRRRHLPQIRSHCRRPSAAVAMLRLALREGEGVEKEEEARQPGLPRYRSRPRWPLRLSRSGMALKEKEKNRNEIRVSGKGSRRPGVFLFSRKARTTVRS
jgi:hypothetical protein